MSSHIPKCLKKFEQEPVWVCFDLKRTKDGIKKVPISPVTGDYAAIDNPYTWGTVMDCFLYMCTPLSMRCYSEDYLFPNYHCKHTPKYIALALQSEMKLVVIDIDKCVINKVISPWAVSWLRKAQSYAEYSCSRTGIHIISQGQKPFKASRPKNLNGQSLEIYDSKRFIIITNDPVEKKWII